MGREGEQREGFHGAHAETVRSKGHAKPLQHRLQRGRGEKRPQRQSCLTCSASGQWNKPVELLPKSDTQQTLFIIQLCLKISLLCGGLECSINIACSVASTAGNYDAGVALHTCRRCEWSKGPSVTFVRVGWHKDVSSIASDKGRFWRLLERCRAKLTFFKPARLCKYQCVGFCASISWSRPEILVQRGCKL